MEKERQEQEKDEVERKQQEDVLREIGKENEVGQESEKEVSRHDPDLLAKVDPASKALVTDAGTQEACTRVCVLVCGCVHMTGIERERGGEREAVKTVALPQTESDIAS